mmetsp:Transcript_96648/g.268693  ORF Transcript_96648/g.268693 Transcript_96648/m.268693 type:complete len:317 (-) Transcript_96648:127-1077(-)
MVTPGGGCATEHRQEDNAHAGGPVRPNSPGADEQIVNVDRSSGSKLGVDIDDSDGLHLVIMRLGPGLIADWNRVSAEAAVGIGDRIVEVNGIRGNAGQMFEECVKPKALTLKLQRAQVPEAVPCPTDSSDVYVHVYDLWGSRCRFPRLLNKGPTRFGLFHTGVEVYGREWYFCGTPEQQVHGVYCMPEPKIHPVHRYSASVLMGPAQLSREALEELIPLIREKWHGNTYHPFKRNCHHFTNFFCQILGFPSGPKFGICGAGDRSLAHRGGTSECGRRCCFPCSSSVRMLHRHSPPLLVEGASHSDVQLEMSPAPAS